MKKKKKIYNEERAYKNFEIFRESALNNMFYSMQRIDLIIISLSTGSIIVLLNFLNDEVNSLSSCVKVFTFLSLLFFALSILINIASQFTAHKLHSKEAEWALQEMDIMNNLRKENDVNDYSIWNTLTKVANIFSVLFLILGFLVSFIILANIIF